MVKVVPILEKQTPSIFLNYVEVVPVVVIKINWNITQFRKRNSLITGDV